MMFLLSSSSSTTRTLSGPRESFRRSGCEEGMCSIERKLSAAKTDGEPDRVPEPKAREMAVRPSELRPATTSVAPDTLCRGPYTLLFQTSSAEPTRCPTSARDEEPSLLGVGAETPRLPRDNVHQLRWKMTPWVRVARVISPDALRFERVSSQDVAHELRNGPRSTLFEGMS